MSCPQKVRYTYLKMHSELNSIRYDAFTALPKQNKKEPLYIALATVIFILLTVVGMIIFIPPNTTSSDPPNILILPALGFVILLFWVVAAKQDQGSARRERAFLQFVEDNKPQFKAELYPKLQPFTTDSLVINAGSFSFSPHRGFFLQGSINGHTFSLYNTILFHRRRSFRYVNPVRTVIEIPLPKGNDLIRCIGENKYSEVAHHGIKKLQPERSERKKHMITTGNSSVCLGQPAPERTIAAITRIATSIKDTVRWSAFEVSGDRIFLFSDRGVWFNEKELRETFEQINATAKSLISS